MVKEWHAQIGRTCYTLIGNVLDPALVSAVVDSRSVKQHRCARGFHDTVQEDVQHGTQWYNGRLKASRCITTDGIHRQADGRMCTTSRRHGAELAGET